MKNRITEIIREAYISGKYNTEPDEYLEGLADDIIDLFNYKELDLLVDRCFDELDRMFDDGAEVEEIESLLDKIKEIVE